MNYTVNDEGFDSFTKAIDAAAAADKCLAKHKAFLYLSHLATLAGYYGDVARKERMYRAANRVIATIQDRTKA